MHDLKSNFDKRLPLVEQTLADQLNEHENFQFYPQKPDMNDARIVSLALLAEALGTRSESWCEVSCKPTTRRGFLTCLIAVTLTVAESDWPSGSNDLPTFGGVKFVLMKTPT